MYNEKQIKERIDSIIIFKSERIRSYWRDFLHRFTKLQLVKVVDSYTKSNSIAF